MRTSTALLIICAAVALALLAPAAPAAARTRKCPQTDPANGLVALQAGGLSCKRAFAVARRTNSVKCFLNGNACEHRFRGRTWHCRLRRSGAGPRVTCRSGDRVVRYRIG